MFTILPREEKVMKWIEWIAYSMNNRLNEAHDGHWQTHLMYTNQINRRFKFQREYKLLFWVLVNNLSLTTKEVLRSLNIVYRKTHFSTSEEREKTMFRRRVGWLSMYFFKVIHQISPPLLLGSLTSLGSFSGHISELVHPTIIKCLTDPHYFRTDNPPS